MFRLALVTIFGSMMVHLGAGLAPVQVPAAVAAALDQANAAFSAAYVRGDSAAMAAMSTTDGLLLPPGRRIEGRAAIARFFTPGGTRRLLAHKLTPENRTVSGDMVVEVGQFTSTSQTGEEAPVARSDRYLLVWRRQPNGTWLIQYDMWHTPAAPSREV